MQISFQSFTSREERGSKKSNLIDIFFLFNLRYLCYTVYFVGNLIFSLFLFHFRFNCCKHIKKQKLLYRENKELNRQAIIGFGSTCFSLFVFSSSKSLCACTRPPNWIGIVELLIAYFIILHIPFLTVREVWTICIH